MRIEGCAFENENAILGELENFGVYPGAVLRKIDKSRVENEMLSVSENVSWININQRGNVLYVKVVDKIAYEEESAKKGYANVVASRDAVIEEITVKSGIAAVKVGQTVKKGDILISGVIPTELGGGFCYAEGTVIGRYSDEISVNACTKETQCYEVGRKLSKLSLNFFNFSYKILENYSKSEKEYGIIKEKKYFHTFLDKKIPVSIEREYETELMESTIFYTKDEMVRIASERMKAALAEELSDKNLLKLRTYGDFSGDYYVSVTEYTVSSMIGNTKEFDFIGSQKGD